METVTSTGNRVIIFSPHPDDDVLACGGLISILNENGWDINIVYMTDGRNSHKLCLGIETNPTPNELARIRYQEAILAVNELGISKDKLLFLNFEDRRLIDHFKEAKEQVISIFSAVEPRLVCYPLLESSHIDHKVTFRIVSEVLVAKKYKKIQLGYLICDDDSYPSPSQLKKYHSIKINISHKLDSKRKSINCHKSQIEMIGRDQKNSVLSQAFVNSFFQFNEYFWNTGTLKNEIYNNEEFMKDDL